MDINDINVPTFESFLAEDSKAISDANHAEKNGERVADKVEGDGIKAGSTTAEEVEKSANAAPGDAAGEDLKEQ